MIGGRVDDVGESVAGVDVVARGSQGGDSVGPALSMIWAGLPARMTRAGFVLGSVAGVRVGRLVVVLPHHARDR